MYKLSSFYFLIILFFACCKKKESTNVVPPDVKHVLSPTVKQFNFKANSKWILKDTVLNKLDSIWVFYATAPATSYYFGTSASHETGETYDIYFNQTLLPTGWSHMLCSGSEAGIIAYDKFNSKDMGLGFFEKNSGDSILYNNNTTWNKLENIHPTLIINGHTYSNVYEFSYHPVWYGFTKIWWCPSIGFVKLEGTNSVTNQLGVWELSSYNVQLY